MKYVVNAKFILFSQVHGTIRGMKVMNFLPKAVFILYLVTLLWLILFKFSFDIPSVLLDFQSRNLNIVPFLGNDLREMVDNFIVFVPFGLFLAINFKQIAMRQKLAIIFAFSFSVEIIQYVLAIGAADITDIITNTFGGFTGLALYDSLSKHVDKEKLDRCIAVIILTLLVGLLLLRTFVFRVRY